jgi:hypothetical protein
MQNIINKLQINEGLEAKVWIKYMKELPE